jgi:electron transport complex protein RnfD
MLKVLARCCPASRPMSGSSARHPGADRPGLITALAGRSGRCWRCAASRWLFLKDGSALVTAWLIALTFPPIAPWWLIVLGVLAAIVVAKHLYGGLGQNPFNPAMVAFCV